MKQNTFKTIASLFVIGLSIFTITILSNQIFSNLNTSNQGAAIFKTSDKVSVDLRGNANDDRYIYGTQGQSFNLVWNSENSLECSAYPADFYNNPESTNTSGSITVTPPLGTTQYEIECTNDSGSRNNSRDNDFVTFIIEETTIQPTNTGELSGTPFGQTPFWDNNNPIYSYNKVFDNNTSTFYDYAYANGGIAGLNLGNSYNLTQIKYHPRAGYEGRMEGGQFQVSSDGTNYNTIYTITSTPSYAYQTLNLTDVNNVQYIRYVSPSGSYGNIAELEVYGTQGEGGSNRSSYDILSTANSAGGNCGYYETVAANSNITLTATPQQGYQFSRWEGLGWTLNSTSNLLTLTPQDYLRWDTESDSSYIELNCYFEPVEPTTYTVTFNTTTGGTIEGDTSQTLETGQNTTAVTAVPNSGYQFTGWTGAYTGTQNPLSITTTNTNVTITANFQSVVIEPGELSGTPFGQTPFWDNNNPIYSYNKVFDNDTSTFYDYAYANGGIAGLNLNNSYNLTQIKYHPRSGYEGRMEGGQFQVSSDGTNYNTIYTISSRPSNSYQTLNLTDVNNVQYIRYVGPNNSHGNIAELEVYGTQGTPPPPKAQCGTDNGTTVSTTPTNLCADGQYNSSVIEGDNNYVWTCSLDTVSAQTSEDNVLCSANKETEVIEGQTFNLSEAMKTSAGIYDTAGRLVRTLWSNVSKQAGSHNVIWDGKDDAGNTVANPQNYNAQVLAHNVQYEWEGTIGHSGPLSMDRIMLFEYPRDGAFDTNGKGALSTGYNEGRRQIIITEDYFDNKINVGQHLGQIVRAFKHIDLDADRIYVANSGGRVSHKPREETITPFIVAVDRDDPSTRGGVGFTNGVTVDDNLLNHNGDKDWNIQWNNVILLPQNELSEAIDGEDLSMDRPFGLAVEQNKNQLYTSIYHRDKVSVYDKITGDKIRDITVSDPSGLAVDANDNYFWVISGNTVKKYSRNGGGALATVSNLSNPLAISVSPTTNNLYVADGGDSQQIKFYEPDGRFIASYGQEGGYYDNGAEVTYDKFAFGHGEPTSNLKSWIDVSADGKIYVGELVTERILVFNESDFSLYKEEYLMSHNYYLSADLNNPTKVFSGNLEYEIDYSQPLALNQGWKLKRNWSDELKKIEDELNTNVGTWTMAGVPREIRGLIKAAITYTHNGVSREYVALDVDGGEHHSGTFKQRTVLYEIVDGKFLRDTGVYREQTPEGTIVSVNLYQDGIRYVDSSDRVNPGYLTVYIEPFIGFDQQGNPLFGNKQELARAPRNSVDFDGTPASTWGQSRTGVKFPTTSTGKVIFFDGHTKDNGIDNGHQQMHLGAVQEGGSDWLWQSSPTGIWDVEPKKFRDGIVHNSYILNPNTWGYILDEVKDGRFHAYNDSSKGKLQYAGNKVMTVGQNIVYGHHGEFFQPASNETGQANQSLHWWDNGLFIGQFGNPSYPGATFSRFTPGSAGNAFSPELVEVDGNLYLYQNDEMATNGIHRWKISNLDSIRTFDLKPTIQTTQTALVVESQYSKTINLLLTISVLSLLSAALLHNKKRKVLEQISE